MRQTSLRRTSTGLRPALYFRRWTRSHAAAFRSLGRCVVIGHLAASVLEQLAGKSLSLLREWAALQLASEAPSESEEELTILSEEQTLRQVQKLSYTAIRIACPSNSCSTILPI